MEIIVTHSQKETITSCFLEIIFIVWDFFFIYFEEQIFNCSSTCKFFEDLSQGWMSPVSKLTAGNCLLFILFLLVQLLLESVAALCL